MLSSAFCLMMFYMFVSVVQKGFKLLVVCIFMTTCMYVGSFCFGVLSKIASVVFVLAHRIYFYLFPYFVPLPVDEVSRRVAANARARAASPGKPLNVTDLPLNAAATVAPRARSPGRPRKAAATVAPRAPPVAAETTSVVSFLLPWMVSTMNAFAGVVESCSLKHPIHKHPIHVPRRRSNKNPIYNRGDDC